VGGKHTWLRVPIEGANPVHTLPFRIVKNLSKFKFKSNSKICKNLKKIKNNQITLHFFSCSQQTSNPNNQRQKKKIERID
jgi:ribosomal protein L29